MATTAIATPSVDISYTLLNSQGIASTSETTTIGLSSQWDNGTGTGLVNMGVVITGYISSGEEIVFDFQQLPKDVWDAKIFLDFSSTSGSTTGVYKNPDRGIKGIAITNTWNSDIIPTGIDSVTKWSGVVWEANVGLVPLFTGFFPWWLPRLNIAATGSQTQPSGGFTDLFDSAWDAGSYSSTMPINNLYQVSPDPNASGNISLGPLSTWAFTDPVGRTPMYDVENSVYRHTLSMTTENFIGMEASGGLESGTSGDAVYYPIWNDFTSGNPWSGNLPRMTYELGVIGVAAPNTGCHTYTVCYTT